MYTCFRNHSRAKATNVYLLLYPRPAVQAAWEARPALMDELWALLRQVGQGELLLEGRTYGRGAEQTCEDTDKI